MILRLVRNKELGHKCTHMPLYGKIPDPPGSCWVTYERKALWQSSKLAGKNLAVTRRLQQAVEIDNKYEDAYLSMAGMYGELKDYNNSILNYEKAKTIDSIYFQDYNLPYSINLAGLGKFQEALTAVDTFLTISNLNETSVKAGEYRKRCYTFAISYEKNKKDSDYKFEPKNLGDSINTAVSEYYPTITIDGKKLIFTRRVNNLNEDFYESNRTGDHWSIAKALTGSINTNMNEGAQNISQDGRGSSSRAAIFPMVSEVATYIFLISQMMDEALQKIWEKL